ncbi:hypothetical protein M0R72_12755 [Candidatus Pacearchaeota archaeon]|jgi:hypothetical protein|nr:hypothetical protein [Candidatus Pacearchaeota archaeon]
MEADDLTLDPWVQEKMAELNIKPPTPYDFLGPRRGHPHEWSRREMPPWAANIVDGIDQDSER